MAASHRRMPNGHVENGDYNSYVPDDGYQSSPNHFGSGPKAFKVRVHVNREINKPGKKILVGKHIRDLDKFLDECSTKTNPPFGCPRRIYTPRGGRQIKYIDDLTENGIYVITGNEAFERHNYRDIPDVRLSPRQKGYGKISMKLIQPVVHPADKRLRDKSARCQQQGQQIHGLRLRVHVIGKNEVPFKVVSIPHKEKDDIIKVTDHIAKQLSLNPIMKLYEIHSEGGPISNFKEIWKRSRLMGLDSNKDNSHVPMENDMHILAVPRGEDRKLDVCIYHLNGKPNFRTSPRVGKFNLFDSYSGPNTPYRHNKKLNKHSKLPSIGSNTMSPASNMSGSHAGGRGNNRQRNQRPAQQVDYDRDDGVFRAKNGGLHSRDARQVNETKETRTERHIDDREAEVVNEEDIRHEKTTPIPPGTELNKQPSKEQKQNADTAMQTKSKVIKKGNDKRDAQKASVKDEANNDSKLKDSKVKTEALDKPQEKVTDDGKNDRNVAKPPSQLNTENIEPNKPPMSTTPPKSMAGTPDIKQNQEHVSQDRGHHNQHVDEYEDDLYGDHHDRNRSQSNQPDSRASRPNDNYERNESQPKQPEPRAFTPPSRGEARRKQQKEDEAAAKIQAGFHGFKARKQYNERKKQMQGARDELRDQQQTPPQTSRRDDYDDDAKRKEKAASVIQASYKGHVTRKKMAQSKQVREQEKLDRQNRAASKIQGGYKGFKVRQQYASKNRNENEIVKDVNDNEKKDELNDRDMKDKAAAKIQSNFKGYMTRKKYKASRAKKEIDNEQSFDSKSYTEREKAASKIQAGFHGYQARKAYASKRANRNQVEKQAKVKSGQSEDEAASKIQASYKGYRERKKYLGIKKEMAEKEQAASRIHASFNGYKTRKEISEKKKAQLPDQSSPQEGKSRDLDKAAATIQSGYRGYKVRKQYNAKVMFDSEADSDVDQLPDSALTRQHINKGQITLDMKNNIATTIQICFRAYHFRKPITQDSIESITDEEANDKVQAAFQAFFARKLEEDATMSKQNLLSRECAATTIQAHYKGFKVRRTKSYPLRQVNLIQAAFRGHITRKLNNVQKVKIKSVEGADYFATLIQGLCRGYMTRQSIGKKIRQIKSGHSVQGPTESCNEVSFWKDSNIKMYSDKTLRKAATKIQCAYHAFIVRNSYVLVRENIKDKQTNAAVSIQAWYRGCQIRKKCAKGVFEMNKQIQEKEECKKETDIKEKNKIVNKSEYLQTTENNNVKNESKSVDELNEKHIKDKEATSRSSSGRKRKATSGKRTKHQTPDIILTNSSMFENESVASRPSSRSSSHSKESQKASIDRPRSRVSIKVKREYLAQSKQQHENNADSVIHLDKSYDFDELEREISKDSLETVKTFNTIKTKKSEKSFSGEVEKEGESPREIEDAASELNKMRKNAMAVSQIQAAFRAYKLRREISELLGGGEELMDIKSVDRAISALKKDFKLRSAKVRRLASYQFKKKPIASDWWDADNEDVLVKSVTADTVQAAFRSFQCRKLLLKSAGNNVIGKENTLQKESNEIGKMQDKNTFEELTRFQSQKSKIEAAYRGYRTRKTEQGIRAKYRSDLSVLERDHIAEKKILINKTIQAGYKGFIVRKHEANLNKNTRIEEHSLNQSSLKNENGLKETNLIIEAAYRGYKTRETERSRRKNQKHNSHLQEKKFADKETISANRTIQAAFKGFSVRQHNQRKNFKEQSASKIIAAFQGYNTRKHYIKTKPINNEAKSIKSASSRSSFHVEMHSKAISNRATILQAAFAAYQTRKVFISLTKIVEQGNSADSVNCNLERMGSLSETDDFKLRHKSIAKIQALEAENRQTKFQIPQVKDNSKKERGKEMSRTVNQIHPPKKQSIKRPQSGLCQKQTILENMTVKSKTQPELKSDMKRITANDKLHGIEIYVKKKMAATVIQAHAKGYFVRQKYRGKRSKTSNKHFITTTKSVTPASRSSSRSKEDKNKPDWVKSEIRARTASIKLEAEKRKLIAQQIKKKKTAEKFEDNNTTYSSYAEKIDNKSELLQDKALTPILSERLVADQNREVSALKIQKVYRGHLVRKKIKIQLKNTAELENEYEEWKKKRLQAAVAIQSIWRGYMVRRELQREQEEEANMIQDPFWNCESPPELLVINIGRTMSEIERANQRYERCSLIQMVVRASKVRRNMHVKMAKRRGKKMNAANIIHAAVHGYSKRYARKCIKCAAKIQCLAKGFLAREHLQDRIRMRQIAQQNAATTLQAAYKGIRRRQDNDTQKEARRKLAEAHQSAKLIQSAIRGYSIREKLEDTKVIMQKKAIIKIKAGIEGYKERRKMKERKVAETKLIAAYRSHKRRRCTRLYKEKLGDERRAASRLQSAFKAYKARVSRRLFNEKVQRERLAATKIQSGYKSYKKRCDIRVKKELLARQSKAVSIIQSAVRGRLERVRLQLLKKLHQDRENATLKIQSMYRGYKDRLSVKKLKHMVEVNTAAKDIVDLLINKAFGYIQQRQESAERIQATVKGYEARFKQIVERQNRMKQRHQCASRIQAVVRAEQGRAWNDKMKEWAIKNTAAIKIQSLYRGHFTRKHIEKEKSMIAEIEPPFMSARTRSGRLLDLSLDEVLMKNARAMILFHKKAGELQAAFRAYKMRQNIRDRLYIKQKVIDMTPRSEKPLKLTSPEDRSAVIIQKTWKGYSDRKAYKRLLTVKRKVWHTAALIIHAAVQGYERRKSAKRKKDRMSYEGSELIRQKRREASDIIAYAFRALKKRHLKVALRVEM